MHCNLSCFFSLFFWNFFLELKIFDLACAKGFVKVPRKRVFTPLSSSLKIATAKLLFLKLNSSMKIPKIIQRIMRWILLVGSPGWTNKYRASVISVLRITYCTFWLIQFYRLFTTLVPQKRLSKCPSRRRNFTLFLFVFFFLRVIHARTPLIYIYRVTNHTSVYNVQQFGNFWNHLATSTVYEMSSHKLRSEIVIITNQGIYNFAIAH